MPQHGPACEALPRHLDLHSQDIDDDGVKEVASLISSNLVEVLLLGVGLVLILSEMHHQPLLDPTPILIFAHLHHRITT
jgi:hypothetical protein